MYNLYVFTRHVGFPKHDKNFQFLFNKLKNLFYEIKKNYLLKKEKDSTKCNIVCFDMILVQTILFSSGHTEVINNTIFRLVHTHYLKFFYLLDHSQMILY